MDTFGQIQARTSNPAAETEAALIDGHDGGVHGTSPIVAAEAEAALIDGHKSSS